MKLLSLVDYLEDQDKGRMGKDLFIYRMPSEIVEGVLLRDSAQGDEINHTIIGYRTGKFQLVVRAQEIEKGLERAKDLMNTLTLSDQQLSEDYFNQCLPKHEPLVFPASDGNNFEFSVNFDVRYSEGQQC